MSSHKNQRRESKPAADRHAPQRSRLTPRPSHEENTFEFPDRQDQPRFPGCPDSSLADTLLFIALIIVLAIILPGFPTVLRETWEFLGGVFRWLATGSQT